MRVLSLAGLVLFGQATLNYKLGFATAADSGGVYPPGLGQLIGKANVLLSAGQFSDAVRAYTEAIGTLQALSTWTAKHDF